MMQQPSFTKRNSSSPSTLMAVEYEALECRLAVLESENKNECYYSRRRNEIEMSWLKGAIAPDLNYVWHACMPLPFWQCREIFEAAHKMPKISVRDLVFSDYDLNSVEEELFDVVFVYGSACGLEVVATELYEGAAAGDPRAVKMYLEVIGLLDDKNETDADRIGRMMKIEMDI